MIRGLVNEFLEATIEVSIRDAGGKREAIG